MGVVGCLGKIVFEVSDKTVRTIDKAVWSGSARHAVHQRHLGHAKTEFTGLDPDKLSFEMKLSWYLGVDTMAELSKIWDYERSGEAVPLVIGEKSYGKYRWVIDKHNITMESYDGKGNLTTAKVKVNLLEYLLN